MVVNQKIQLPATSVCRAIVINAPEGYRPMLSDSASHVTLADSLDGTFDFIHVFITERSQAECEVPMLLRRLTPGGSLWVSYPRNMAYLYRGASWNKGGIQISLNSRWLASCCKAG